MSKFTKILAAIIGSAALFMMTACDANTAEGTSLEDTAPSFNSSVQETENVAAIYNAAVQKLTDSASYTMTGSTNSSAVMGDVCTSVVTSIDCGYAKNADGSAVILMNSEQNTGGNEPVPHTTYIADGKYYISAYGTNYIVNTNDFGDYDAFMLVKRIEETAISNYEIIKENDSGVCQVRFEIPFGVYNSEALDNMIGIFADDSLLLQPVTVRATIDESGMLSSIYISMENTTSFDDALIEQSIVISLRFSAYNETIVTAPADLASYEDRTQNEGSGQNPEGDEVPESFTGDSLD